MRSQYLNTAKNHHDLCHHRSEFLLSVICKSVDFKMLLLIIFIPNDRDDNYDDDYDDYDDVDDMTMTVTMMMIMMGLMLMMMMMMMMLMNIIVIMKVLATNVSFNCLRRTWSQ